MKTNETSFTGLEPELRAEVDSLHRQISKVHQMLQDGKTK